MIKVLAYADAGVNSGFERVMRGVMTHLRDTGNYDITVEGVRYDGNTSLVYPFKVLPLMDPSDGYGALQIDAAIKRHKPDVVWLLNDLWIHGIYFANKLALDVPVVAYYPVDTPNMKWGYALGLGAASQAVAYTNFGAMETAAAMRSGVDLLFDSFKTQGVELGRRARWLAVDHPTSNKLHVRLDRLARYQNPGGYHVIPHGLDHELFAPRDKATCRRLFGLPEDAFIVMNVGTNQFRKRQDLTMRAFKLFADKRPDARLVLHCQGEGMQGWDLQQMARYLGIADKLFLTHAMNKDWSEDELVSLYNAADVMINTAGGEGWGLPNCESAACGIPQLVPDWSATREIWNGFGMLLPVADFRMEPKYLNTIHANIDVQAAADALYLLAEDETRCSAVGDLCKYRADAMWSWPQVGAAFDRVIQQSLVEGPANEMSFQEVLNHRVGEVRSELEGMALLPPREVPVAAEAAA